MGGIWEIRKKFKLQGRKERGAIVGVCGVAGSENVSLAGAAAGPCVSWATKHNGR